MLSLRIYYAMETIMIPQIIEVQECPLKLSMFILLHIHPT